MGSLQVAGVELQRVEDLDTQGMALFRGVAGKPQTLEVVQALSRRADVLYAQPNYIRQALRPPTIRSITFSGIIRPSTCRPPGISRMEPAGW